MTAQQSKSYRSALVRIIRNAGQLPGGGSSKFVSEHARNEDLVEKIGRHAPSLVAAHLSRLIEQRKRTWERGDGSGDATYLNACNQRCDALQSTVDAVLALFGIVADWGVGLYPVYRVNGYEEHDLLRAIRESFAGKATR